MEHLDYQLTVHTPYRAFEGHLIEMKTRLSSLTDFDLEQLRAPAMQFFDVSFKGGFAFLNMQFQLALVGDAMLIYPPTQIALSGLKYGLDKISKRFIIDF